MVMSPPLLVILLAATASCASAVAISFQVEPKVEDCVMEDLRAGAQVDAQVLVTRGGKLDIKFTVRLA